MATGPKTTCLRCGAVGNAAIQERQDYWSLFFIPLLRSSKFFEMCVVCHHGGILSLATLRWPE
jgi:hypothetical protein